MTEITKIAKFLKEGFKRPGVSISSAIALFTFTFGAMLDSSFGTTAAFYVAGPFIITAFILLFEPVDDGYLVRAYGKAITFSFLVFVGVSIVLREGIICFVFTVPIYLIMSVVAAAADSVWLKARKNPKRSMRAYALPAIVAVLALEGTHDSLSFDRNEVVRVSRLTHVPVEVLRENIGQPHEMPATRHWFLKIFPMPERVVPPSMRPGAIHQANFTYHRWLFTNTHRGHLRLQIADTSDLHVATRILEDTSYLSHYLQLQNTRIDLRPIDENTTEVSLTVHYERRLDPAWYFAPLQRYGVARMAELLIEEVVIR